MTTILGFSKHYAVRQKIARAVMTLFAWILVPIYFKKTKVGFVFGIILLVSGLGGLFASLGNPPWYTFTNPISIVKELSFVIDSLAGIYFSYKSYKEL